MIVRIKMHVCMAALAGSLLVVLLLRTAHFNLAKLRDVYLHTNTLAALANLAPHAENLSSHAAQRLVSLFDMLARRCAYVLYASPIEGKKSNDWVMLVAQKSDREPSWTQSYWASNVSSPGAHLFIVQG